MSKDPDARNVDTTRLTPISYSYAHKKLTRARGKATSYDCEDCGRQAAQWSYTPGDPHEQTEMRTGVRRGVVQTYPISWSPNVWAYVPLCGPCHAARDRAQQ